MPSKSAARPDSLAQSVARQIRTELTARDLDLSALVGIIGARSYVYSRLSVEKATHALTIQELATIADFLGMQPLELFRRASDSSPMAPKSVDRVGYTAADEATIRRMADEV